MFMVSIENLLQDLTMSNADRLENWFLRNGYLRFNNMCIYFDAMSLFKEFLIGEGMKAWIFTNKTFEMYLEKGQIIFDVKHQLYFDPDMNKIFCMEFELRLSKNKFDADPIFVEKFEGFLRGMDAFYFATSLDLGHIEPLDGWSV